MPPEEGQSTSSVPVSMDDLKEFKDSLTSTVAAEMQQMREMITQLFAQNGAPPPSVEEPILPKRKKLLLRLRPK